jgi:hypothetical protein
MALFEVLSWQKEMRNFSLTPVTHLSATGLYYYVDFAGFPPFFDQRQKQDVALRHLLLLPPTFISPLSTNLSDLCDLCEDLLDSVSNQILLVPIFAI